MIPGATLSSYLWHVWWNTVRGSTTCLRSVRHTIATSYEMCRPVPTDTAIRTQWHLLGVPVCVAALAAFHIGLLGILLAAAAFVLSGLEHNSSIIIFIYELQLPLAR